MSIQQRLADLWEEASRCQREIEILDEQVSFQREVSGEAKLRAVVSETPLADREADEAGRDLARMERVRQQQSDRLQQIKAEIDRLLDEASGGLSSLG